MNDLSTKLRTLRKLHGFKQEYVGHCVGLSQSAYSRIENGDVKNISLALLEKILRLYSFNLSEFLSWNGSFSPHPSRTTDENQPTLEERLKYLEQKLGTILKSSVS